MKFLPRFFLISILIMSSSFVTYAQEHFPISEYAWTMKQRNLVDVSDLDSSIQVRLIYASPNNFVGEVMYGSLREAYLQVDAARKLMLAQKLLKSIHPTYSLVVYDAARPQSVQQIMWERVKNTPMRAYVSSPKRISMHTYGVAIDVSIIDLHAGYLDMGTKVDYLGKEAQPKLEQEFLAKGILQLKQIENRNLLRKVMKQAGFRGISNEWWHFEACTRKEAEEKYSPLMF